MQSISEYLAEHPQYKPLTILEPENCAEVETEDGRRLHIEVGDAAVYFMEME